MRVKAGPGVMEQDGDTVPGQMVNPAMEEVSNTISPSISSPHPVVGMMKILVQRRGSSASIQVDTVNKNPLLSPLDYLFNRFLSTFQYIDLHVNSTEFQEQQQLLLQFWNIQVKKKVGTLVHIH